MWLVYVIEYSEQRKIWRGYYLSYTSEKEVDLLCRTNTNEKGEWWYKAVSLAEAVALKDNYGYLGPI